jgi:hypothetical protein
MKNVKLMVNGKWDMVNGCAASLGSPSLSWTHATVGDTSYVFNPFNLNLLVYQGSNSRFTAQANALDEYFQLTDAIVLFGGIYSLFSSDLRGVSSAFFGTTEAGTASAGT